MKRKNLIRIGLVALGLAVAGGAAISAQDKYTVKVQGGLGFAEFMGYEGWQVISTSYNEHAIAVIVGNPEMIRAFQAGIPDNGEPFPDGARMAKIHWTPKPGALFPQATVSGALHDVDFMVKDSKRFGADGGWGYAVFIYDDAAGTFRPGNETDQPPQANDAKCGVACHVIAKSRDSVFSEYGKR